MDTRGILESLLKHGEDTWLDWKRDLPAGLISGKGPGWEKGRAELLKDLVSIANGSDGEQYGYLVYGVSDLGIKREIVGMAKPQWDDAVFQQWAAHVFDPRPLFVYSETIAANSAVSGIFRVERTAAYPHVVKASLGNILFEGQVWFRHGTGNAIALSADLRRMFAGDQPFKGRPNSMEFKKIEEHYRTERLVWQRLEERDIWLERGYRVAHYPGTRREVHAGDSFLLVAPKTS